MSQEDRCANCGKQVSSQQNIWVAVDQGKTYFFCSIECFKEWIAKKSDEASYDDMLETEIKNSKYYVIIGTDNYAEDLMDANNRFLFRQLELMKKYPDKKVYIVWFTKNQENREIIRRAFRSFKDVEEIDSDSRDLPIYS